MEMVMFVNRGNVDPALLNPGPNSYIAFWLIL